MPIKRNITLLLAIAFCQGLVFYGPIATLYRQAGGISVLQITLIESLSVALGLLLELPWGIVADKIGYKRTMIVCCFLYLISKLVFWRAQGFGMFLTERLLLSVVLSGLSGVNVSMLYLSCDRKNSQRTFAIYNNIAEAGLLLAALVYTLVIRENYRLAGLLTVFSFGAAALLSLGLVEVKNPEKAVSPREFVSLLRQTLTDRRLVLFLLGIALLGETHQTVTVFLNQLQYVSSGMSNAAIGAVFLLVSACGLLGVFSQRLTRRLGRRPFTAALYLAAAGACAMMMLTDSPVLSVLGIATLRLCYSLFMPLATDTQNALVKTPNRATALSINAVFIGGMGAITNPCFGKLAELDLRWSLLLGCVLCLAGLPLVLALPDPKRNQA